MVECSFSLRGPRQYGAAKTLGVKKRILFKGDAMTLAGESGSGLMA